MLLQRWAVWSAEVLELVLGSITHTPERCFFVFFKHVAQTEVVFILLLHFCSYQPLLTRSFFPSKVQAPPGLPPLPSVFPVLPAGSHSAAGAVLRGPGGAGGLKSGLGLRPLRAETRPAPRRGPQGQWPHRRLSGESACPTFQVYDSQVPLSFLRRNNLNNLDKAAGAREGDVFICSYSAIKRDSNYLVGKV